MDEKTAIQTLDEGLLPRLGEYGSVPGSGDEGYRERYSVRGRLTALVQNLILTENYSDRFTTKTGIKLHELALKSGAKVLRPLCELVQASPARWSLEEALTLVQGASRDPLAKLALLEQVSGELGRQWSCESSDFVRVSVASARLQTMLRSRTFQPPETRHMGQTGSALITAAPGEDHVFAPCLLEEMFRCRGWGTKSYFPQPGDKTDWKRLCAKSHIVCFSWSTVALRDEVFESIAAIRDALPRGRGLLLAGGIPAIHEHHALVRAGVDHVCANGYIGLAFAERFAAEKRNVQPG